MKLLITNNDGEVYVAAADVHRDERTGRWLASDEEGEVTQVTELLNDAASWELASR